MQLRGNNNDTVGAIGNNLVKVIPDLKLRSPILAKEPADMLYYSNMYNDRDNSYRIPIGPGVHKFLSYNEKQTANPNYKDFNYYINDLGYRDPYPDKNEKNIFAFFGCSMTFGEGLSTEDNFPHRLSNYYNMNQLNLGQIAIGAHRIAQIFLAAANIWTIDKALVLLPNWARFHYVDSKNKFKSIHLPYENPDSECERIRNDLLNDFSDQYMLSSVKDAINHIIFMSKYKKIKLILSSWDPDVSEIINHTCSYNSPKFKLWDPTIPAIEGDYARDNGHPGVNLVTPFISDIIKTIQSENYVR